MALNSIRNIRGFFSDYWLGSILSAKKGAGSKLTKAQAEKTLWRLTQLRNRIEGFENLDLTRFREQFARPLLGQVLGFNVEENPEETRVRLLTRQPEEAAEGVASAPMSEDLKAAVFRAAEILIRGFLEDIQARPEAFNPKPTLGQLRDTALHTLYRLLFILYAEAETNGCSGIGSTRSPIRWSN